ncbi:MAG: hypothetical protein ACETVR_03715 [Candidatus Bathyarchaeia archaeon]
MDWEEAAYTIIFFTILIMIAVVVFPLSLMGENPANPTYILRLRLFLLIESVGALILTSAYALLRVKEKRRSRREEVGEDG